MSTNALSSFLSGLRWRYVLAHAVIVAAANWAVQYVVPGTADFLTWGAFVFPFAFFVTDLCNRRHGVEMTRRVVLASFVIAVIVSFVAADPRIAIASGVAFISGQLVDAQVFNRFRKHVWWVPPSISNILASTVDSTLFWVLAFAGTDVPWVSLGLADYAIKIAMVFLVMPVYGYLVFRDRMATA
ncbi:membrane protein [Labrys miyagiensis]|uniref:Probable queuosine precursor transporter n=1 Tax=Labrys miyagiensis TaxID=346912 RepID=A0ABQ6CKQ5_9HYPH|nr:queuosine precursor transporter [Labrys miyagiensis]GLS20784.1 membrane protein [Labrys miyagiensis]